MCIITLTRIFHLTYQYQTLVREITTPSLPAFITASLNLVSVKPSSEPARNLKPNTPFLETVLHALVDLIARHPTIFRPFSAQIHSLVLAIIGSSPPAFFPESVVNLAVQLFVSLHNCAPKNAPGDQWKNAIKLTISSIHRTADHVFRAVVEQWESVDATLRRAANAQNYDQEMGDDGPDPLDLAGWHGVHSGADRLIVLLRLLSGFLSSPTASTVSIPLGYILDLTSRLMSVTVPSEGADASAQLNLQIGREERDALWTELPRIHVACIDLFISAINALGTGIIPAAQTILEHALWVFRAEKFSREIRTPLYNLIRLLVSLTGPSMMKQSVSSLAPLLRTCCSDLLPPAGDSGPSTSESSKRKSKTSQASANADSFLNTDPKKGRQTSTSSSSSFPDLFRAASELIPAILNNVPTEYLPPSLRAEIDRTIILTADRNAMLASVLNPVPILKGRGVAPSILPFLARSYPDEMEVESLIRPRMPVLMTVGGYINLEQEEEEEKEAEADVSASTHSAARIDVTSPLHEQRSPSNQPQETKSAQAPAAQLQNKRSYTDEPNHAVPTAVPDTDAREREDIQTKKARFDTNINNNSVPAPVVNQSKSLLQSTSSFAASSVPAKQSSDTVASVSLPSQAPASNVGESITTNKSAGGTVSGGQPPSTSTSQVQGGEDSDDELPTLNIDPDTEDDEEDEDVNMEG